MTGGLHADPFLYGIAGGLNTPPPPIPPDPVAAAGSTFDQLLAVLGLAANFGDPADTGESQLEQAERELKAADAQAKFPANEEQSAAELAGVGQEGQLAQAVPQMAAGMAGALAGAFGGALQPLSQIPQQLAQAGQQAMQMGMGALQQDVGSGAELSEDPFGDGLDDGLGGGEGDSAVFGDGEEAGGFGGTAPTAMLGPPPTPSAGTVPASAQTIPAAAPGPPPPTAPPRGGIGAMPTMPAGMHGAGGLGGDAKADTKRVTVPSIKNGAPVQGRITTPPPPPAVTKRMEGKPVAARRVVVPAQKTDSDGGSGR